MNSKDFNLALNCLRSRIKVLSRLTTQTVLTVDVDNTFDVRPVKAGWRTKYEMWLVVGEFAYIKTVDRLNKTFAYELLDYAKNNPYFIEDN